MGGCWSHGAGCLERLWSLPRRDSNPQLLWVLCFKRDDLQRSLPTPTMLGLYDPSLMEKLGLIPACTAGASPLCFLSPKPQPCSGHVGSSFPGSRLSLMLSPMCLEKGLRGRELPKELFGGVLAGAVVSLRAEAELPAEVAGESGLGMGWR